MTNAKSKLIFRIINQETGMLITKYPDDENIINNLYQSLIDDEGDEALAYKRYINLLIKYCEQKEFYEKCILLLKLKNKLNG
ncbi:hypothetical protein ABIC84_003266 [Mucilaginibacter sp. 3215]